MSRDWRAEVEAALTGALGRLPHYPASPELKRRLRAAWPEPTPSRWTWRRRLRVLVPAVALAALAAVLVYGHRLHTISLLVFRADGLDWPRRGWTRVGGVEAYAEATRGFNTLLWRRDDLGYALISDVEPAALRALAARLAPGS